MSASTAPTAWLARRRRFAPNHCHWSAAVSYRTFARVSQFGSRAVRCPRVSLWRFTEMCRPVDGLQLFRTAVR